MNFWDTVAGHKFAEYTVPQLTDSINELVKELKKMNAPSEEVIKQRQGGEMLYDTVLMYAKKNLGNPVFLSYLLSLWTSYCVCMDYEVDTLGYDKKIAKVWDVLSESEYNPFTDFESFDNYMCQNLV